MIFGLTLFQLVLALAALLTACGVIYKMLVRPIVRAGIVIHKTYEKVIEYDDRLSTVEKRSEQLVNNSGSSLKDAVDRIEGRQQVQAGILNEHLDWAQAELLKVWQNLASRDAVEAAAKTAEMIDQKEREMRD